MKLTQAQERALVALYDCRARNKSTSVPASSADSSGSTLASLENKRLAVGNRDWDATFSPKLWYLTASGLAEAKRLKGEG